MRNPDKPELKIEDLWYRFALTFLLNINYFSQCCDPFLLMSRPDR